MIGERQAGVIVEWRTRTKQHRYDVQERDFHFRTDRRDDNKNAGSGHQNSNDTVKREHLDALKRAEKAEPFESRRDRNDIDDHRSQEASKRREAEHNGRSAGVQKSNPRNVGLVEKERRKENENRGHRNSYGIQDDRKREDNLGDKRALEEYVNKDNYGSKRCSKDEQSYDDAKRRRYTKIPGSLRGRIGMNIIPPKMQADTGTEGAFSFT